jgi:hypothetical protein
MNPAPRNSTGLPSQSGRVLFLGMVRRGEFESLQKRDLPLGILIDTNSRHQLGDVSRFALVERFDFSRPMPELIGAVREIQKRWGIACLFNVMEFYVAQTAEVAAALGLPGISAASALLCRDKCVMRRRFQERIGPGATARFQAVTSESGLLDFAKQSGYPVFLQPSNVAASMWATRNTSPEMLRANYRALLDEVPKYFESLGKKGAPFAVVVAEYLQGSNTSIDCIADAAGRVYPTPVVDVLTGQDVGIDDYHHFARIVPTRLSAAEQAELAQLAVAGVQSLDMTTCAAHVEFIGTRLGEIAARPGGNRARILELAFGLDELHACYQVLCGQKPDLHQERQLAAAIVTPFSRRDGTLRSIRHLDRLTRLPGYLYHEMRAQPGQSVGLAKNGCRAPLYIELMSADAGAVRASVDQIASWTDLYEVN